MIEQGPERRRVEELAQEYRDRGYTVSVEPRQEELPPFLRGTQPDLIAIADTESVIIEVKRADELRASEDLPEIARRVEGQPGWRFELVAVPVQRQDPQLQWRWSNDVARQRLLEARKLAAAGHNQAAFLLAYAATEAVLFAWASSWLSSSVDLPTATAVAKRMVVTGALPQREVVLFERLARLRNSVAHGIKEPELRPRDVQSLVKFGLKVLEAERG